MEFIPWTFVRATRIECSQLPSQSRRDDARLRDASANRGRPRALRTARGGCVGLLATPQIAGCGRFPCPRPTVGAPPTTPDLDLSPTPMPDRISVRERFAPGECLPTQMALRVACSTRTTGPGPVTPRNQRRDIRLGAAESSWKRRSAITTARVQLSAPSGVLLITASR